MSVFYRQATGWIFTVGLAAAAAGACGTGDNSTGSPLGESGSPAPGATGNLPDDTALEQGADPAPESDPASGADADPSDVAVGTAVRSVDNTAVDPAGDTATGGPRFPGAGTSGAAAPLQPGTAPDTAEDCAGGGPPPQGQYGVAVGDVATLCFYSPDEPELPGATIEQVVELVDNVEYVHIRLTLDPRFVDNSYGANAVGWEDSKKGEHKFKDLVGSDHAEIKVLDASGETAVHCKVDYISEDPSSPSGYATLGVTGGDREGEMLVGDPAHVLAVATSMDRNFNGCGLDQYTEDSPPIDESYAFLDPAASNWDFRVAYEIWISTEAFGQAGVGQAIVEFIHASPSKTGDNTMYVDPGDCPPDWDCFSPVSAEGKCL